MATDPMDTPVGPRPADESRTRGGDPVVYAGHRRRVSWPVVTAVTWLLLLGVTAALYVTARARADWVVILGVAVVGGGLVWGRSRWFHRLPPETEAEVRSRLVVPSAALAFGLQFLVIWLLLDRADGWFFLSVSLLLLAASQLVSEARLRPGSERAAGRIAGYLVLPLAVGVAGVFTGMSTADLVATMVGLFVLAVVLGLVGERAIVRRRPNHLWRLVLGLVLVVAGLVALWAQDLNGLGLLVVSVLVLGLVGSIVTNTDLDAVAGIAIVAFGLSLTPSISPESAVPTVADGQSVLVALGDSYISGEGADEYLPGTNDPTGNRCRRSPTAYPIVAVGRNDPSLPEALITVACSGAKIEQVHDTPQYEAEPLGDLAVPGGRNQLDNVAAQLGDHQGLDVDLVVLSMSGNDAGFGEIGQTCLAPGDCTEVAQQWLDGLRDVDAELEVGYEAVRDAVEAWPSPDGRVPPVVVVPYPMPLDDGECGPVPFTEDEVLTLQTFVGELHEVIERRAAQAGFHYLEAMEDVLLDGHALCDGDERDDGVNFIGLRSVDGELFGRINPKHWTHNSLHPNELGHRLMADVLVDFAGGIDAGPGAPAEGAGEELPAYEPVDLSTVHPDRAFVDCSPGDASVTGVGDGGADLRCRPAAWWQREAAIVVGAAVLPILAMIAGAWLVGVESTRWVRERRRARAIASAG